MGQSALMPARVVNDYIVFSTETRGPSDPMHALAKSIAEDMAAIVAQWTPASAGTEKPAGQTGGPKRPGGRDAAPRPAHPTF
jgi:hypothetical protein